MHWRKLSYQFDASPHSRRTTAVKKNLAAYRYLDEKVIPLYVPEVLPRTIDDERQPASALSLGFKRMLDILSAVFVLVFGLPFYALMAFLIKLTSEGPVLFVSERVGRDGKPFTMYKFRTMVAGNCDEKHRTFAENFIKGNMNVGNNGSSARIFKMTTDKRITSIGRFLRKTSLDELPQFINVLKGEMSLVGPRPPLPYELPHYQEWHKKRLVAKPGLTGLWQVSGRSTVPFDEMVLLDLYYIENWSLLLDLKIIARTVPVMLNGSGAY